MTAHVLIVDDEPAMLRVMHRHLAGDGFAVTAVETGPDAIAALGREAYDVVITDLMMTDVDGLEVLRAAQRLRPGVRVILMTAFTTAETAITAMREGAYDYLSKPFKLGEVSVTVRRALEDRQLREEHSRLRHETGRRHTATSLLGRSAAMGPVLEQIAAVSASEAAVLLIGESGTGKELAARAIHGNGARRAGPFVAINCAAIPDALLESELFGHERGAFTGAQRKRRGLFAEASGGTLFLDEIADMSLALQAKLLRALQDKAVRPVGGNAELPLDLRVISATNRDLPILVRQGAFREDLYYRLNVIAIRLPSLRERGDDIPLLAHHFLDRAAGMLRRRFEGFADDAMACLVKHPWPGNVRQLENVVERAATLAKGPWITRADVGSDVVELAAAWHPARRPTLQDVERHYVEKILAETKGDKTAAARILGVSVRTLQRMFKPSES
jgi:DNA-binding NtrC family response regulator